MGVRAKWPIIPPEVRLAITLRLLAGASYIDMKGMFDVEKKTVYEIFTETLDALMNALRLPGLPKDKAGLRRKAFEFQTSRSRENPLCGCVGALDGIAIRIRKPSSYPARYFCRKGWYALPVQALVDARY